MALSLKNVLSLFGVVFGTQRVGQLHLRLGKDLLLEVVDLALLVVGGALAHRDQGAVVFIVRTDGHVVETAVRHACYSNFYWALAGVHLGLARVHHALGGDLVRGEGVVLFDAGSRLK